MESNLPSFKASRHPLLCHAELRACRLGNGYENSLSFFCQNVVSLNWKTTIPQLAVQWLFLMTHKPLLTSPPRPLPPPDPHGAAGDVLGAWALYKNYFPGGTRVCLMPGRLKSFVRWTRAAYVQDPLMVRRGWRVHRSH